MSTTSDLSVRERFQHLQHINADRLNPSRFNHIQTLIERSERQRPQVAEKLTIKASALLDDYLDQFIAAQAQAAELLASLIQDYPTAKDQAENLFSHGNFNELWRLQRTLVNNQKHEKSLKQLSGFTQSLLQSTPELPTEKETSAIDALLAQQDATTGIESKNTAASDKKNELKSLSFFRSSMKEHARQQKIRRAIDQGPENPGPLNPHKLAINSLENMERISSQYLNRFVSYLDTLLWLEAAGDKLPQKRK